jgi:hypothetical protein
MTCGRSGKGRIGAPGLVGAIVRLVAAPTRFRDLARLLSFLTKRRGVRQQSESVYAHEC